MLRAVIYARFSSDMQREESIDAQVRACKAYCQRKGYAVVGVYSDEAKSGRSTVNRDGYNRMLADAVQGDFDVIIFHKIDRNSRNELNYYKFKDQLARLGVSYEYASQSIDCTPEGQMMESVLVGMAAYYSRNLAKEVRKGQNENAYKAISNGGIAPFGLKLVDQRYVIDEREADGVRMIFAMYLDGHGYGTIAKALADAGYTTRTGKPFAKNSMHDILANEKYAGVYVFGKAGNDGVKRNTHAANTDVIRVEDAIPAIISKADFAAVKARMERNKRAPGHYNQCVHYLLAGKISCGECGAAMVGHRCLGKKRKDGTRKEYLYYLCGNRQRNSVAPCSAKMVDKAAVENAVLEMIQAKVLAPTIRADLAAGIAEQYRAAASSSEDELTALRQAKTGAERRLSHLYDLIETGTADQFDIERLQAVKCELIEINKKLATQSKNSRLPALSEEQISAVLDNFYEKLEQDDKLSQQRLIDLFLHRVTVYVDHIHIELTIKSVYDWLVEMRGVEPLSENIAIQLSPSADVILYFALRLPDDGPSHCYPKEFPLKPIGISLKVSHY